MIFNQKWERYEQNLMTLMGLDIFPSPDTLWSCQLLFIPAFHHPCSLRITRNFQTTFVSITLLQDNNKCSQLFDFVWKNDVDTPLPIAYMQKARCHEDVLVLNKRHCDEFLDMFTTIHAMRLRHVYNAERDGISILCQSYLQGEQHAFRITSPQIADDPHHVMLISSLIHIAQQEILKIEIHEYLATLDRYLK